MRDMELQIDKKNFISLARKIRAKKCLIEELLKNTMDLQLRWSKISRKLLKYTAERTS